MVNCNGQTSHTNKSISCQIIVSYMKPDNDLEQTSLQLKEISSGQQETGENSVECSEC